METAINYLPSLILAIILIGWYKVIKDENDDDDDDYA